MAGKKLSKNENSPSLSPIPIETLIVGAGPSGLFAGAELQRKMPNMQILILESEDRSLGRIQSGLHITEESLALKSGLKLQPEKFGSLRFRWDRSWVPSSEVPWDHKDFAIAKIPQVERFCQPGPWREVAGMPETETAVAIKNRSPVNFLKIVEDSSKILWEVVTPLQTYWAERVIWAAGMVAFQNAFGKQESQALCTGNPLYQKEAADFRGGIALELEFSTPPSFEEGFPVDSLFGLPVRFESKLYPCFGIKVDRETGHGKGSILKVLMNLPDEILLEPKVVSSVQKALKRSLLHIVNPEGGAELLTGEKWLVSSRIRGSVLGNPWIFSQSPKLLGIEFVGDETQAAAEAGLMDLPAALESVKHLTAVKRAEFVQESESDFAGPSV